MWGGIRGHQHPWQTSDFADRLHHLHVRHTCIFDLLARATQLKRQTNALMPLKVSVIIPTINESANIANAITKAWAAGASEVIVVDGGSNDETASIAQTCDCKFIHSDKGRAAQQNLGESVATGDVLLFLHADCWLEESGVEQITQAIDQGANYGCFFQKFDSPKWKYRWLERGNSLRTRFFEVIYGDQGLFIRRELFRELGKFPDEPFMEDLLFSRTLRKHSRPVFLPGPLYASARRWEKEGFVRQQLRNWHIVLMNWIGWTPTQLKRRYKQHDE